MSRFRVALGPRRIYGLSELETVRFLERDRVDEHFCDSDTDRVPADSPWDALPLIEFVADSLCEFVGDKEMLSDLVNTL